MKNLLTFDKFIVPEIITVVYWLSCLFVIIFGLYNIFSGGISVMSIIVGLAIIVIGLLMNRVGAEMTMVIFKINQNIQKIADKN